MGIDESLVREIVKRILTVANPDKIILFRLHIIKYMIILSSGNINPEGGKGNEKGGHLFAFDIRRIEGANA